MLDGWLRYWSDFAVSDSADIVHRMLGPSLLPQWSGEMSVWDRLFFLTLLYERSRFGESRQTQKRDAASYFTPRVVANNLVDDLGLDRVFDALGCRDEILVFDACAGAGNLIFAFLEKLAAHVADDGGLFVRKIVIKAVEKDRQNFAVLQILLEHCARDLPFVLDTNGVVCDDVLNLVADADVDVVLCNPPWFNFVSSVRRDARQSRPAAAGLSPRELKRFVIESAGAGAESGGRGYEAFVSFCLDMVAARGVWAFILPAAFLKDQSLSNLRRRIFFDERAGGVVARVIRNADELFSVHPDFEYVLLSGAGRGGDRGGEITIACKGRKLCIDRSLLERVGGEIALVPGGLNAEWQIGLMEKLWSGENKRLGDALQTRVFGWQRQFDLSQLHEVLDAEGHAAIVLNEGVEANSVAGASVRYLPVLDGRMVDVFGLSSKSYVSGFGRSGVWRDIADGGVSAASGISAASGVSAAVRKSQFLMSREYFLNKSRSAVSGCRLRLHVAYCAVSGKQNSRLMKACLTGDLPHSSAVPVFFEMSEASGEANGGGSDGSDGSVVCHGLRLLLLLGLLNSSVFDFALRQVLSGNNLNKYLLEMMPVPAGYFDLNQDAGRKRRVVALVARLALFGDDADFRLGGLRGPLLDKVTRFCDGAIERGSEDLSETQCIFELDALMAGIFGVDDLHYCHVFEGARLRGFFRASGRKLGA